MATKPRKTTKLTDFVPMQKELQAYRLSLRKMVEHIETYLPEKWQSEGWFKQAKVTLNKYKIN